MTITIYKFHTANSARDFFSAPRRTLCVFCDCRANKVSHQKVPPGTPLDFSLFGEPHDQGLVFKWGSLVGIEMPTTGASNTQPFVAGDVAFRPREFTGTITNWASVPYCTTDFGDYSSTATDHLSRAHTPANIARGIGDICRYMGVVDGSQWRMPTAKDWEDLYGSAAENGGQSVVLGGGWTDGNYYPLSGRAMGPHQTNVAITGNGANARVTNADPNTDGAVFLPASGYRHYTNGAIYRIGSSGLYWSSTTSTIDLGCEILFSSSSVYPQNSNARTNARSIRCIRE